MRGELGRKDAMQVPHKQYREAADLLFIYRLLQELTTPAHHQDRAPTPTYLQHMARKIFSKGSPDGLTAAVEDHNPHHPQLIPRTG